MRKATYQSQRHCNIMDPFNIIYISLFALLVHYLYGVYQKRKRIWDAIEPLGGSKWYPIVGTLSFLLGVKIEDMFDKVMENNMKHRPIFRAYFGFSPCVYVMKAEYAEAVLSSTAYIDKGDIYRPLKSFLGEGLITSGGSVWRHHRKLITPAFHLTVLDSYTDIFNEKALKLTENIAKRGNGTFYDFFPEASNCALDVICETAMGIKIDALSGKNLEYTDSVGKVTSIVHYRIFHPHLHNDTIFYLTKKGREFKKHLTIVNDFVRQVIQDRKSAINGANNNNKEIAEEESLLGKKKRKAFLDILLEENKKEDGGLNDEQIREEVDTFLFAGHDSSALSVTYTLFFLGNYPEIQEQVFAELDEIFDGEDRPITPQDVLEMKFLDRVVKESVRLIPVAPSLGRKLKKDIKVGEHFIPAGVNLMVSVACLHRDPDQFPNPERFDPDRFLPENSAKRHPYAYIPFSAGPRNCIGQKFGTREVRITLATILRKFKVKSQQKLKDLKFYMAISLRPLHGVNLAFEPREKSFKKG